LGLVVKVVEPLDSMPGNSSDSCSAREVIRPGADNFSERNRLDPLDKPGDPLARSTPTHEQSASRTHALRRSCVMSSRSRARSLLLTLTRQEASPALEKVRGTTRV
jgi:hypothetical protein